MPIGNRFPAGTVQVEPMPGGESEAICASVGLMRSTFATRSAVFADVLRASQRSEAR